MTFPKTSDIVGIINRKYPFSLAESWDNVGLQIGDPAAEVRRIMVALDPLPEVIDEALSRDCSLLVTHHPLIFKPLRQITTSTGSGAAAIRAIRGNLALLAMHTNYDIARDGLNDLLADRIGLQATEPLQVTGRAELLKLVVYLPEEQLAPVRQALLPFAEQLGNYSHCSFSTAGQGTFLPLAGARPAIGTVGTLENVHEQRLELLLRRDRLPQVIKKLIAVHPYEEPAFDCYPLLNEGTAVGLGRIGRLPAAQPLASLARRLGADLGCSSLRFVGQADRLISSVALCSGSGASLLHDAARAGADLLVTGDIKYHEAREAEMLGICLLDAGHFATEQLMVPAVISFLTTACRQSGWQIELFGSCCERDPFTPVPLEGV